MVRDGCAELKKLMHVRFAELESPFDFFKHRPTTIYLTLTSDVTHQHMGGLQKHMCR